MSEDTMEFVYNGRARYLLRWTSKDESSVTADVHQVMAWNEDGSVNEASVEPIATVYQRFDGCVHIGVGDGDLNGRWTHVCGVEEYKCLLAMLEWLWKVTSEAIPTFDDCEKWERKP